MVSVRPMSATTIQLKAKKLKNFNFFGSKNRQNFGAIHTSNNPPLSSKPETLGSRLDIRCVCASLLGGLMCIRCEIGSAR